MKLAEPFSCVGVIKTLLCSVSNKRQELTCNYLTDIAQSFDADMFYSSSLRYFRKTQATLLVPTAPTQPPMQNFNFDQSEADTVLFSPYAVLRESGYSGCVIIDASDTDAYVAAAVISQQLPGILCIKRKQMTVFWISN